MNEVDLIIHYMRQSKMDSVRREIEKHVRAIKEGNSASAEFLLQLERLFRLASNNAPLP